MKVIRIMFCLILLFFLVSCSDQITSYEQGITQLTELNNKYDVTLITSPPDTESVTQLLEETITIGDNTKISKKTKTFLDVIDFRRNLLVSEQYQREGFKWGKASTTEVAFGCRRGSSRILNSTYLRNISVIYGINATILLTDFILNNPEKAAELKVNEITTRTMLESFNQINRQVIKDNTIIQGFCFKKEDDNEKT